MARLDFMREALFGSAAATPGLGGQVDRPLWDGLPPDLAEERRQKIEALESFKINLERARSGFKPTDAPKWSRDIVATVQRWTADAGKREEFRRRIHFSLMSRPREKQSLECWENGDCRTIADDTAIIAILHDVFDFPCRIADPHFLDRLGPLEVVYDILSDSVIRNLGEWKAAMISAVKSVANSPPFSGEDIKSDQSEFVGTDVQMAILMALDGKALKVEELAKKTGFEKTRFYAKRGQKKEKKGALPHLRDIGLVKHIHGVGFYRPDKPPPDRLLRRKKVAKKSH